MEAELFLNRDSYATRRQAPEPCLEGRSVLVTGAGGSIGQEVVAQVCASRPSKVVLLDHSEFALYRVERRARQLMHPGAAVRPWLVDVRDDQAVLRCFEAEQPEYVLHTAAYKHVPMLEHEQNVLEAVRTNVLGTYHLLAGCQAARTRGFVLFSTDKAVEPSSLMGATKRLAELVTRHAALDQAVDPCAVAVVRFGNVLGSSGSVIPLFEEQITAGGPVTVTHREATRFFMTVREAVHLSLKALGVEIRQERPHVGLYVLDMGEPVRIWSLAEQMIRMKGLRPGVDVEIREVGLRPGEKLHERLLREDERPYAVQECPGLLRVSQGTLKDPDWFDGLLQHVEAEDSEALRRLVMAVALG